jgi:hypothetical protein
MKLGAENKKKTVFACVFLVVAAGVAVWQIGFSGPSEPSSPAAAKPAAAAVADTSGDVLQPTAQLVHHITGRERRYVAAPLAPSLDPRLRLDMMKNSEEIRYEGAGHNIFQEHAEDAIPTPAGPGRTDKSGTGKAAAAGGESAESTWHPKEIPPPPINLKFYGFASAPGEPKAIFLSQGEAVYVAHEGDVIARRYRVGKISASDVEIEDVLSNNKEKIKLTPDHS